MPVDYDKVKKIFLAALEIPTAGERIGFLDEACGADVDLRNFVQGMLDAHEQHATPIPEGQTRVDPQYHKTTGPSIPAGTVLADKYKIIDLIAEGGMGSVYRATRIADLKMEVAIKVIKPGMDSQQVLARFNIERQALAIMKHENIARVLDAGMTEQGLPFFVMELVKGLSLTKYCDQAKLPVPERLELFEKVCSAIQHAHQKGIVHRDLKPTNILVALYDDKAVPKVIDFGLAKALHQPLTDDLVMTKFGTFVGTWQYTAPEQAQLNNLDIDTRADIYSLGVILYELLTGTTPVEKKRFTNAAYQEVLRLIRDEEPLKPSTKIHSSDQLPSIAALRSSEPVKLERLIRGELDWIVMKALDKDRNRRYNSALEFAQDLQRFRFHEPVQAGPPTFAYRASKYLRKHWGAVLVTSLFVTAVTLGAVVSTIGWVQAIRERERANTQTEIAVAINEFLRELLSEADPSVQIKPDQAFVSNITVKKALDQAAKRVGTRFSGKPLIEAAIRHTMGKTYLGLGDLVSAREQFEKAEQLRRQHAGEDDPQRLESLYELGWVDTHDTKYDTAESKFKEVLDKQQKLFGPTNASILKTNYAMGTLLELQGKLADARSKLEKTLDIQRTLLGPLHIDTLLTQRELAEVLQKTGELEQAEKLLTHAVEGFQLARGKDHPETFITQNNLAMVLDAKQDFVKAELMLIALIAKSEPVLGSRHPVFLLFQCNLAAVYDSLNKHEPAIALLKPILPTIKQVNGPYSSDTLAATLTLGVSHAKLGKYEEAEPYLLEAHKGCLRSFGRKDERTRIVIQHIIGMYKMLKNELKEKEFQKLLEGA